MAFEKLKNKVGAAACYLRSMCKTNADREFFGSMFEREWEVFVIKRDPITGKLKGETVCCEAAPVGMRYESKFDAAACC